MEKFKGKNLILVCVAVVMSLFLLIQTSSAYFTGDDSVAGGDVAVPHITKPFMQPLSVVHKLL